MEYVRFGELYATPSSNGVSRPSAVRGKGFHMINMGELFSNNIINEMAMDRVLLSEKEQQKFFVEKGDLLFARQSLVASGAGKCSIVHNIEEETTFESHLIRVRLNKKCNPWYYYYLFQLPYNPVKTIVSQCAQAGIRGNELQKIKVPFPTKNTQDKIASILSTYDTLIENNTKRIRLLEQMAENLYKEWFVRFRFPGYENVEMIDGLPKGWKVEKLEKIADYRQEKISGQDIALYVSTENMLKDCQGLDVNAEIETPESRVTRVLENDILISNIRPYFKKIWFATQEAGCSNDVLNIHAKEGISSMFLFHSLRRDEFFDHMVAGSNGTKMPRGNKAFTMKFKLLVPPLIVMRKYDSIAAKINEEIHNLHRQSSLLSRQRDLLLPRLMSGKLEVKQTKS